VTESTEKPPAQDEKEAYVIYAWARTISESKAWRPILGSTLRRVRFEDGYVKGWFDHKDAVERAEQVGGRFLNSKSCHCDDPTCENCIQEIK